MPRTAFAAMSLAAGLTAAGLCLAPPAAADPVVVALWHLDEASGATVMVDSVGSHNGAITGGVTEDVHPAVSGGAYQFTGTKPIVKVPSTDDLNPYGNPLTLSAWLDVPSTLGAGDYNVLQKGSATASGGAYKLEIVGTRSSGKFGYPDCAFNSPGGLKNRVFGPLKLTDDSWHEVQCHLTSTQAYVTVDGVSGKPIARTVGSIANTAELTLGGKPTNTHFFDGRVDEVSITIG